MATVNLDTINAVYNTIKFLADNGNSAAGKDMETFDSLFTTSTGKIIVPSKLGVLAKTLIEKYSTIRF